MTVVDRLGLADPLAARLKLVPLRFGPDLRPPRWRAGHEKELPLSWVIARYADFGSAVGRRLAVEPDVAAARRAIGCGQLHKLLTDVTAPLTLDRFVSNIGDSWSLRSLRVDPQPQGAARALCGS